MSSPESTIGVRPPQRSESIGPAEWEERRRTLTQLLTGIAQHADLQMMSRCPYRNRLDQCTSSVGCRNKRKPERGDELPHCGEDGGIDYRSAWESDPDGYEPLRRSLRGRVVTDAPVRERLRAKR